METNDLRKQLRELIASGEEEEALEKLLALADAQGEEIHELILHSSNRYQKLHRNLLIGNISREEASVAMAKITQSLLDIVDEIEVPGGRPAKRTVVSALKSSRQLKAIMFTDIVGYTALMQESERAALQYRQKHRRVFEPTTREYGGQIIQYYGDGTLSIFDSTVAAVRCGCALQRQFMNYPAIPVRIGIHFGEVVLTESDIIGDSVNLASRVESLGTAGSVLISGKVAEEIGNQEDLPLKSLGSFHFKNDKKKREIYAVAAAGLKIPESKELEGKLERFRPPTPGAGLRVPIPSVPNRRLRRVTLLLLLGIVLAAAYWLWAAGGSGGDNHLTAADWSGAWQQERQTTGPEPIEGVLTFEIDDRGRLTGSTNDLFPDGYENHELLLFQLDLSDDGRRLQGRYQSKKLPKNPSFSGSFQFEMAGDRQHFRGTYNTQQDPEGSYFWRGSRKK